MKINSLLFSFTLSVLLLYSIDGFWGNWLTKQITEKQIWILNKKGKLYNLAFLGSSRVYTCVDIDVVQKKTRRSAVNLGCDGASLMENFVILKQFLNNGNKIEQLYLQLDNSSLINMKKALSYPFHDYLFLNKLNQEEVKNAVIENSGYLKYFFWRYFPLFKYAEFNHFYSLSIFYPLTKPKACDFNCTNGTKTIPENIPDSLLLKLQSEVFQNDTFKCDEISKQYVEKILQLCSENNISCTFFKVPVYNDKYIKYRSSFETERFIRNYSKEKNCRFIDFQKLPLSENKNYFKDYSHLNEIGAKIFSSFLSDSLIKNL